MVVRWIPLGQKFTLGAEKRSSLNTLSGTCKNSSKVDQIPQAIQRSLTKVKFKRELKLVHNL